MSLIEENDEIVIVDPNTGRLMKGRQWSDGLHQAVEAKEGISIKQENNNTCDNYISELLPSL